MLLQDNVIFNQTYKTKKMVCYIGMNYEKIHVYSNENA